MAAWIAAGAAVVGDVLSSQGQKSANAQTMASQLQAEQYDTQMSNTAMQRRVADLKAAGLNPGLAYSQGGASTPTISGQKFDNPDSSFSQLGTQVSSAQSAAAQQTQATVASSQAAANTASAQQAQAQAALAMANAQKVSGVDTDAQKQNIQTQQVQMELYRAQTDAASAQASLSNSQVQVAQAQLPKIQAEITNLGMASSLAAAQSVQQSLLSELQGLTNAQFKLISPSLVESAANAAKNSAIKNQLDQLQIPEQANRANIYMAPGGSAISYMNTIMNWFHLGANLSMH